eukprot:487981_1
MSVIAFMLHISMLQMNINAEWTDWIGTSYYGTYYTLSPTTLSNINKICVATTVGAVPHNWISQITVYWKNGESSNTYGALSDLDHTYSCYSLNANQCFTGASGDGDLKYLQLDVSDGSDVFLIGDSSLSFLADVDYYWGECLTQIGIQMYMSGDPPELHQIRFQYGPPPTPAPTKPPTTDIPTKSPG